MEQLIQYCTKDSLYDGPFDNTAGWKAAGMGYLLKTENGKLIAIDGGNAADAEDFLALIKANSADAIPEVDLWILTHPHPDHYYTLLALCENEALCKQLKIKTLLYHFPDEFQAQAGVPYCPRHNENMQRIREATGAEVHLPTTDERLMLDGMELHILYTPTDCSILNNPNQLSLIFTAQGAGKKVLFTGDAFDRNLLITLWRYDKALKCDVLQMPHHGLCDTGNLRFYKRVAADTLLLPTCIAGDRAMHTIYADKNQANQYAEDLATTVYRSFEGTVTISL